MDSTSSTTMAQSVTTDASRVDQLNMLNVAEGSELTSLAREGFGATSTRPNCGLKRDRRAHGKRQDAMRHLGCEDFNLQIFASKASRRVLASSMLLSVPL